jgi:hypothetical protein
MAYPVVSLKQFCTVTAITNARVDNMPVKDFASLRENCRRWIGGGFEAHQL